MGGVEPVVGLNDCPRVVAFASPYRGGVPHPGQTLDHAYGTGDHVRWLVYGTDPGSLFDRRRRIG